MEEDPSDPDTLAGSSVPVSMPFTLGCLAAYLLGAIPFALVLVRLLKGVDVRAIGSGNVGATNAARAFEGRVRPAVFAMIYVLDFGKGFVPTLLGPEVVAGPPSRAVWLGACAIVGHCASPFLGLRGGKGVATATGVMAAIEPVALLAGLLVFGVVLALFRRVFLGSLALGAAMAAAVVVREPATAFEGRWAHSAFALALAAFLVFTHRSNLRKLLAANAPSQEARP